MSGDSGATVWDQETGKPTAMIFAAAGRFAVACPLPTVLKALEDQLQTRLTLRIGQPHSIGHVSGK